MDLFHENSDSSLELTKTKFNLPDADIVLFHEFFTKTECEKLFKNLSEKINWQQYTIKMFGKILNQPRLTAFYGEENKPYAYSGLKLTPNPWTEDLMFIKSRITKTAQINFSSVLLNYYRS